MMKDLLFASFVIIMICASIGFIYVIIIGGLLTYDLIKEWIDNNTEQRLVDPIHNRYETVPNSNYEVKFDEGW